MSELLRFPTRRTEVSVAAEMDLADKPMSECLAFWANDLRHRGLITEASYLDAAVLTIRDYERARAGADIRSGSAG